MTSEIIEPNGESSCPASRTGRRTGGRRGAVPSGNRRPAAAGLRHPLIPLLSCASTGEDGTVFSSKRALCCEMSVRALGLPYALRAVSF